MATLGQRLREERERRGLSIEHLAAQTRIHPDYFRAIERDDTASLPGGFFYRSFVRQYARLMELPESAYQAELDRSLESEIQDATGRETALPDRQISVPRMPTGRTDPAEETRRWAVRLAALILAVAACTGGVVIWQRWPVWTASRPAVPEPPASIPAESGAAATVAQSPAQPVVETQPPATPAAAGETAAGETPAAPASEPAQPSGPVRVILRATEMTWVGVWQGQKMLFSDVLHPGETRGFGAEDKLRVRLGNAGGVTVEWNGRVIPPPGPRGQVRTLDFWADGYAPVQPPAPNSDAPAQPEAPAG
jgi:cytoskeletal protein RodZ